MASQDQNGIGAYSADNTATAQAGPAVTVTSPSGLISTGQPSISWTTAFPSSAQQTSYQVLIYNQSQYTASGFTIGTTPALFDTGVVAASTTFSVSLLGSDIYLTDNVAYRAYVQITETGGQTSNWVYSSFTTSYTALNALVLTPVGQNNGDVATFAPPSYSFLIANSGTTNIASNAIVQYSDDGGVTWAILRNWNNAPFTNGQTVYDFEQMPNVARQYQAYGTNPLSGVEGPASNILTTTYAPTQWWVTSPLNPTIATSLSVVSYQMTQMEQATPHTVLGQEFPVILASVMGGKDGSLTVQTTSDAIWAQLQAVINAQQILWLTTPLGDGLYIRFGPTPGGMGSGGYGVTSKQAKILASASNYREITLTYVEQGAP
jgi:hypothetical protein